ncbi:hypothetical protein CAG63_18450 [Vibrio sp. V37_P2S8PM304]|uniref:hypothetical protein n=1 Tax=Vibrio sp. V37_P2S8PM304 TaxID=1938688 RepID=UPI0013724BFE|nr:hypothetical protein [Vibrio sp. V37_P2S8PM304]NAX32029.1 hypothetical protein [Vibrio sp. V37_P2S8PM304]
MESLIDAIKKRSWGSVWLSLQSILFTVLAWLINSAIGMVKIMFVLYLCGFAVGFGGWVGLSSAIGFEAFIHSFWPAG